MKKTIKKIFVMALICVVVVASMPEQKAKAADNEFYLTLSYDAKTVNVSLPSDGEYKQIQMLDTSKKWVLKEKKALSFTSFKVGKNKAGLVRFRYIDREGFPLSEWSETIGYVTYNGKNVKQVGKKLQVSYKLPKIKGVKKYVISISTKKDKGFRKIKTVKPGKKAIIKNYKGKAFKLYKNYYVQIKPIVKGAKIQTVCTTSFFFRKTFY